MDDGGESALRKSIREGFAGPTVRLPDMNAEPTHKLTRREALLGALTGAVAMSLASSAIAIPETLSAPPALDFVPENDYPFFGGAVPDAYLTVP